VQCPECNSINEHDSLFCVECGKPLHEQSTAAPARSRRAYPVIFVLAAVLALVLGLGYYKFFLPDGIAAVVNGEDIKLSELDAAIVRTQRAPESVTGRLRYQMLNEMIAERLVLQEATKAKISVSRDDIIAAEASARSASGLDEKAFEKAMQSRYGSLAAFKHAVERNLLVQRFIAEKVAPSGTDTMTARVAVNNWLQEISGKSTIRIALAENGSNSGCGSKAECGKGCNLDRKKESIK